MPSARSTPALFGFAARSASRRATASPPPLPLLAGRTPPVAHALATAASNANPAIRTRPRIVILLAVGVEHVLEPHPLLVEVEIHVPGRTISILVHLQLGRAFDAERRFVHLFPIEAQHHIGVLLERAADAEVVELRTLVTPLGRERRQMRGHDHREV